MGPVISTKPILGPVDMESTPGTDESPNDFGKNH